MASEMIEKVARAIHDAMEAPDWSETSVARAAIEALLKPTEAMMRAWVTAQMAEGIDPDRPEPMSGTGQGDLQIVAKWVNIWNALHGSQRWQAALTQALED